ncbi:hypothetical protein HDU81_002666 [Chytriomyces hyalinus]|nr:hypothetical protein HDU81_002666 [Chytriomyces hyalinus]
MAAAILVTLLLPLFALAASPTYVAGAVSSIIATNSSYYTITTNATTSYLSFLTDNVIRLQTVALGAAYVPPLSKGADMVIQTLYPNQATTISKGTAKSVITFGQYNVNIGMNPFLFSITNGSTGAVLAESKPLVISSPSASGPYTTTQTLQQGMTEQFFGGGMQNGRFTHRGNTIEIKVNYKWDDGGNPNAVPFYMTTAGYAIFRNTFTAGMYDFKAPVTTSHEESQYDAPFLPPLYGLEMGDSDCYLKNANRGIRETLPYTALLADEYIANDMPIGWMNLNDGYGCGYQQLQESGLTLSNFNITLGLWTESNLTAQPFEVGVAGVYARKLDVAWIGDGYAFALAGCQEAYDGIEAYSPNRGYVWMVEGWAGAQRCSVVWSGDQSGDMAYTRFQIPTYQGSTMSGQAWSSGDIDGIFGGSPESYVRDLQHKAFAPVLMSMSGWAKFDKQPWRYAEAWTTGVGPVRPLVLEFQNDPVTWTNAVAYEFLFGTQFLVSPVYVAGATSQKNIYLPAGTWIDYWNKTEYVGQTTILSYYAPLSVLPLFVKAGSIIPMYSGSINNYKNVLTTDPLLLDVYPVVGTKNSFNLYDDDKTSRRYRVGEFSYQLFSYDYQTPNKLSFTIGAANNTFAGQPSTRPYTIQINTAIVPNGVSSGYAFTYKNGVLSIAVPSISITSTVTVTVTFSTQTTATTVSIPSPSVSKQYGFSWITTTPKPTPLWAADKSKAYTCNNAPGVISSTYCLFGTLQEAQNWCVSDSKCFGISATGNQFQCTALTAWQSSKDATVNYYKVSFVGF